ncbi:MAG: hypothetical protein JXQ90_05355 [Cyclobacteriaceae bacterium]
MRLYFYLLVLILTLQATRAQTRVVIAENQYTGDTAIYLKHCAQLIQHIIHTDRFRASVLSATIHDNNIRFDSYSNKELLDLLLKGNSETDSGNYIVFNILKATEQQAHSLTSAFTKAFTWPADPEISYVNTVLGIEMNRHLDVETAGTLLHEYMHVLGFVHHQSLIDPLVQDVPTFFGDLLRSELIWQKIGANGMVGNWRWIYSIESNDYNDQQGIISPSGELDWQISSDGQQQFILEGNQQGKERFFPIHYDRIGISPVELPFEIISSVRLKQQDQAANTFLNLGQDELTLSNIPSNLHTLQLEVGKNYQHIFVRIE